MASFFGYLVLEGPALRVEWEIRDRAYLAFENASVALYVFAGTWFVSVNGSRLSTLVTYSTPRKAIQPYEGYLKFKREEQWWNSYCGIYRSTRSQEGMKCVVGKVADEIVSKLTSLNNPIAHGDAQEYEVKWGEVDADIPYFDSYHDEVGNAVHTVQILKAAKGKKAQYLGEMEGLRELLKNKDYKRLMFRRGEPGFRGVADSVIMRVGFSARGNLLNYRGKWVRMVYDEPYGFNLFLLVQEIEMPRSISRRLLKAIGPYEEGELEDWQGSRVPPHWHEIEVNGKTCNLIDGEWKPIESK